MQDLLEHVAGFAADVWQTVVALQDDAVGMGVGLILFDGLREPCLREVGGDDADETARLVGEGDAVGDDDVVIGERAGVVIVVRVDPAGPLLFLGRAIPHLGVVVVVALALGDDAVALPDGVGREVSYGGRVEVGLHGDGTTVDVVALRHDAAGVGQQTVGCLVLVDDPLEILRDGFDLTQVAAHSQRRLVERFLGTLQGLLLHELTGTDVEQSNRRDEEQGDEGGDGDAEFQREGVAVESDLAHALPPSFCDTSSSW